MKFLTVFKYSAWIPMFEFKSSPTKTKANRLPIKDSLHLEFTQAHADILSHQFRRTGYTSSIVACPAASAQIAAAKFTITQKNSNELMLTSKPCLLFGRYARLTTSLLYAMCHQKVRSVLHPPPPSLQLSQAVSKFSLRGTMCANGVQTKSFCLSTDARSKPVRDAAR